MTHDLDALVPLRSLRSEMETRFTGLFVENALNTLDASAAEIIRLRNALDEAVARERAQIGAWLRNPDNAGDWPKDWGVNRIEQIATAIERGDPFKPTTTDGEAKKAERGPMYHRPTFECDTCQTPTTCAMHGRCMPIFGQNGPE